MPLFSTEKRIPSCLVDKALIEALETYIRRRIEELPKRPDDTDDNSRLSIEITDTAGTEKVNSVREFGPTRFHDGTKDLQISYQRYHPSSLEIRVRFALDRESSWARVQYEGKSPREFVIGLIAGIREILAQSKTFNSWFHLGFVDVIVRMIAVLWGPIIVAVVFLKTVPNIVRWSVVLTAVVLFGYVLIGLCNPYSAFDSTRTQTLRSVSNWLLVGLAGFILFTVGGVYLRVRWLGF